MSRKLRLVDIGSAFFNVMASKIPRFRSKKTRLRKEFKTRLLFDETARFKGDKDNRKYYHCANCNQICHEGEHSLGGSNSGDAITHFDFSIVSGGIIPGNEKSAISILRTLQRSMASLKLNSDGGTKTVVHNHRTTMGGCPLCGSLNWRADFP